MDMSYVTNQLEEAKYNYNYFFMKMIIKVLQICFKLSFILLLSSIFNYLIINIIAIICTIISFISIYNIIKNYVYIIEDIRDTLNIDLSFELDLNVLSNNLFKGMINFYVGDIFHSKKRNGKIEKAVLYSKDKVVYIDLLNEKEYTTDTNENDYVIEDSLIPTDTNDFKEDYNYLLYRYSNGMVKSKKKHWYNFNRK